MSKISARSGSTALRTIPAPWKSHLILACGKCRKKLKHSGEDLPARNLKRELKRLARHDDAGIKIRVISVSCLKLCPKGAVTVATQDQLARNECSLVKTRNDIRSLYQEIQAEHLRDALDS
jgi:predicted metal-binding protein